MNSCSVLHTIPILFIIPILFLVQPAVAQTGSIEGRVVSADTGEPITDVNVGLEGTSVGAATNSGGRFTIVNIEAGSYTIVVTFVGYEDARREIRVRSGQATRLNIKLSPGNEALSEITVVGARSGYQADVANTALKTDTPIIETPQSISVISGRQLQDQDVDNLGEALRYSAGAQGFEFGLNPRNTSFSLRGFSTDARSGSLFQDGLQLRNPTGSSGIFEVVPYGAERIELFRGPASVLYGQISPGGLVNFVTKRPPDQLLAEAVLEIGSFNEQELKLDLGGPITEDGKLSYRFTGLGRESDSQIDFTNDDRIYLAPALTWHLSSNTKLTVLSHYQRDETKDFQFLPIAGTLRPNPNGSLSPRTFTSEPDFGRINRTEYAVGYLFEQELGKNISFKQKLRYNRNRLDRGTVFSGGLQEDQRTLNRFAFTNDKELDGLVLDNQIQAGFTTAGIRNNLLLGVDYQHFNVRDLSRFGEAPSIDVFDPSYGQSVPTPSVFEDSETGLDQFGVYLQDQIAFGDHVRLTLSGRYDFVDSEFNDNLDESGREQDDNVFTGRAGIVYRADNGLAPYFSYSESFMPIVGTNFFGDPFEPTRGQQFEIGTKYQPPGSNIFATVSLFDLRRQNILTQDPDDPMNQVQTGERRSHGLEIESQARLAGSLNLIATYTFLDAEITESNVLNDEGERIEQGETPERVPRHRGALWAKYGLPFAGGDRLSVGAGTRYTGESFADVPNTIENPDFLAFDGLIEYTRNRFRIAVNATNIFDNEEVVCFGTFCNFRPVRQVVGSIRYKW